MRRSAAASGSARTIRSSRDRVPQLMLVLVAMASCAGGSEQSAEPAGVPAPVSLTLEGPIGHLDTLAREPMVVEHPDGTLFVTGYGGGDESPDLWASTDGGTTWERVDVGTPADGADGGSCVDLAVAADGTLYFMTMGFANPPGEGTHIAVGVSHDVGASWSWTYLSQDRYDDRPWVEVAPSGTAHAIWNDGAGVSYAVSTDGGRTWAERERIHPVGGSSHLAVGPNGEVAARVTPSSASGNQYDEGVELIAVSTDEGRTWRKNTPPGTRVWNETLDDSVGVPRWVEPLAWDATGALYHVWSEGQDLWLGRSTDQGETWSSWPLAHDDDRVFFPYLVGRGAGELAATWFSGRDETLHAHVARIQFQPGSADAPPQVLQSTPFQLDAWTRGDPPTRDTAGEYVPVTFLQDGTLAVATPIQDPRGDRWGFSWWRLEAR